MNVNYPVDHFLLKSTTKTSKQQVLYNLLDFIIHLQNVYNKVNETIGLLHKLRNTLPRASLITISRSFIRIYLAFRDTIYYQAYNNYYHRKMESVQLNLSLANTGVMRGTARKKIYQESELESI